MPDVPTLLHLYGDTLADASTLIGRSLLARGLDGDENAIDVTNVAPALAPPGTYEQLARELDAIDADAARPTIAFAVATAADARRFAELRAARARRRTGRPVPVHHRPHAAPAGP